MNRRQPSSFGFQLRLQLPLVIRVLVILVLIAAIVAGALFALRGCSFGNETVTKGGRLLQGAVGSEQYYPFGDKLLVFDGSTLSCYNEKAESLWQYQAQDSGNWSVTTSQKRAALYCDNRLVLLSDKGEAAYMGSMDAEIENLRCGQNSFAVELKDAQGLLVLDRNGSQIDQIDGSVGELVDFGFYSSNDLLWVLSVNVSGLSPVSRLDIYKPGKELVSSYKSADQLYYKPLFYQDDIYLIGTETLDLVSAKTTTSYSVFGWQYGGSAQLSDGQAVLLTLADEQDKPSVLRVFRGGKFTDLHVPANSLHISPGTGGVYVADGQTLKVLPYETGAARSYAFRYTVDEVLCCFGDCLAVKTQGGVYLVRLP